MIQAPPQSPRASVLALLVTAAALALATVLLSRMDRMAELAARLVLPTAVAALEVLAFVGVSYAAKHLAVRWLAPGTRPRIDSGDLVLGMPLFGALTFLVASARAATDTMATVLVACAGLGALALLRQWRAEPPAGSQLGPLHCAPSSWAALALLAVALLASGLLAQLPPYTLDELSYHLATPRLWLAEGRAVPLPLLSHSFFPQGTEAASLPALALLGPFGGGVASHLTHLAVSVAVTVRIYRFLESRLPGPLSLVGTCLAVSTPCLLLTAGVSWNDWAVLGCVVLLVDGLDRFAHDDAAGETVALALGAGLLSKYTFAPLALILLLATLLQVARAPARRSQALRVGLLGSVLGSVFFIRNLIEVGNPVAPFLEAHAPKVDSFGSGSSLAESLASYAFDTQMVDESLGATLLLMAVGGLLPLGRTQPRPTLRGMALVAGLALVGFLLLRPAGRLLVPFLVVPALFGWLRTSAVLSMARPWGRRLAVAACFGLVGIQLAFAVDVLISFRPLSVLGGRDAEHRYLETRRDTYAATRWLDKRLPADSRTLVLGLQELYWFDGSVIGGGNFDGPRVAAYLTADSPAALHARLRADGVTHLAVYSRGLHVDEGALVGRRAERITRLPPQVAALLRALLDDFTRPVEIGENTGVYRLR